MGFMDKLQAEEEKIRKHNEETMPKIIEYLKEHMEEILNPAYVMYTKESRMSPIDPTYIMHNIVGGVRKPKMTNKMPNTKNHTKIYLNMVMMKRGSVCIE